jgi:hypothetical protein
MAIVEIQSGGDLMAIEKAVGHRSSGPLVAGGHIMFRENWQESIPGHAGLHEEIDPGDEVIDGETYHFHSRASKDVSSPR